MALYRFTIRFQGVSALPEDVYENVLYYDVTTAESGLVTVADGIFAAYNTSGVPLAGISGAEIRVYAMPDGGQPVFRKSYAYALTGMTGPGEVALCLSYAAVDDWDLSTRRRRGRIFLGPLAGGQTGTSRPAAPLIADVIELGTLLKAVGGADADWMIWSPTDGVASSIESVSVDNSWDTQRRRGIAPTTRQVVNV